MKEIDFKRIQTQKSAPSNVMCNQTSQISWVVFQLRICRLTLPPLRSGHLDIKDAKCAKKNDGREISYRVWAI